jgi:hypothetical protein
MITLIGLAALTLHCLPHLPTTPKAADIPRPPAVTTPHTTDEDTITAQAAAVYVARAAYRAALETPNPATALDGISDALPDVMPKVLNVVKTPPALTSVLHAAITDRLSTYTAIEHARVEAGDGYSWIFDLLVEQLEKGANPDTIRTDALAAPRRIRDLAEQAGDDQ